MTETLESARDIFSRAARDVRTSGGDEERLRGAMARLAAIRDRLRGRERRQVEIYLGLLEDEWEERPRLDGDGTPRLAEARAVVLDALRRRCPGVTAASLERLAALARAAPGRAERTAIARLAEPVILLHATLERVDER